MIRLTTDDGRALVEGRKAAYLCLGAPPFIDPAMKRFRDGEERKLYETLKRFISSGSFGAIVVYGFDKVLSSAIKDEVCQWLADHCAGDGLLLVLSPVEAGNAGLLDIH